MGLRWYGIQTRWDLDEMGWDWDGMGLRQDMDSYDMPTVHVIIYDRNRMGLDWITELLQVFMYQLKKGLILSVLDIEVRIILPTLVPAEDLSSFF